MPQGRKGACVGAKASQHFSMCSCCQVSQQIIEIIAVPCVAPTFFARHHSCACCPLVLAHWLPTASRGPHSRTSSHASAFQHVTTCRACGSEALRRPVFSSLDCSVLSWRPIHPGQLELSGGGGGGMAMRQRKLGSHTPPCHRRMVITTLFSVLLAALQRRPVLGGVWRGAA